MFRNLRPTLLAFAFVAIASLPVTAALAVEPGSVTSSPATPDVGQSYVAGTAYTGTIVYGGLLPSSSNGQGEPELANSLPPG